MLPGFRFHHIGYAVKDITATAKFYLDAGWTATNTVVDTFQNTQIAFLSMEGMPMIELVSPARESSPVNKTLEKNGNTPYHICYEVDDIEQAITELRKLRFVKLFNPVPAAAIGNRRICYLFNAHVGLIEIVEK